MVELDAIDLRLLDALQQDAARSNYELAAAAGTSPPTALRRLRRLQQAGFIERQVALLAPAKLAESVGHGLTALCEVTLDRQDTERLDAFEARACAEAAVQQCWRVSPGPDFVLVLHVPDMPAHLALTQQLFSADANVRNVRSFFATKRAKFDPRIPLGLQN